MAFLGVGHLDLRDPEHCEYDVQPGTLIIKQTVPWMCRATSDRVCPFGVMRCRRLWRVALSTVTLRAVTQGTDAQQSAIG